jgi:hypothetical protein
MKLTIEGTAKELREKRGELLKALVREFRGLDDDLADLFQKALPKKEPQLKYRVLRELQKLTADGYRKTLDRMLEDISAVLDQEIVQGVKPRAKKPEKLKKDLEKAGPYIGPRGGKYKDPEHKIPWEEPKKIYQYGMHFRPAGFGGTPKGHTGVKEHPAFRHGVIEYDRPLTPEEIKSFELEPILSEEQLLLRSFPNIPTNGKNWQKRIQGLLIKLLGKRLNAKAPDIREILTL